MDMLIGVGIFVAGYLAGMYTIEIIKGRRIQELEEQLNRYQYDQDELPAFLRPQAD